MSRMKSVNPRAVLSTILKITVALSSLSVRPPRSMNVHQHKKQRRGKKTFRCTTIVLGKCMALSKTSSYYRHTHYSRVLNASIQWYNFVAVLQVFLSFSSLPLPSLPPTYPRPKKNVQDLGMIVMVVQAPLINIRLKRNYQIQLPNTFGQTKIYEAIQAKPS